MPDPAPNPELEGVFRRPFDEQIAFFRGKLGNLVPTARWDDIKGAAHDQAFMVAGAAKADLLADLAGSVDKAIAEGRGLEEFRAEFKAIVAKHGWTGWTGEGTAQGEAWRTKTILRTNSRTSYAAGRMAQLRERGFPLWVYFHGGSEHPRKSHLALNGLVLPADHPAWAKLYPPSDWGCSCYVSGARSERAARRLGGDPDKKLPAGWEKLIGDGWDYAPGATAMDTVRNLRGKLDVLPARPSIDLIQDWLKSSAFERWSARPSGNWPLARLPDEDAEAIGSSVRVADLSEATMQKQQREHPELDWTDYRLAQSVIDAPTHRIQDGPTSLIYVQVRDDDAAAGGHVLVVKATRSGNGLFVVSFRRLSRDQAARDRSLRQLLRKGGE